MVSVEVDVVKLKETVTADKQASVVGHPRFGGGVGSAAAQGVASLGQAWNMRRAGIEDWLRISKQDLQEIV